MGYYANVSVARSQVHCRRPFLIFWPSQHLRSHSHVLLLYDGCHGTSLSKVPLVETTLDPLQMLQFVAIMIHGFQLVFYDDCDFPWQFAYYIGLHAVLFFGLFSQFYINIYFKKTNKKPMVEDANANFKVAKEVHMKAA